MGVGSVQSRIVLSSEAENTVLREVEIARAVMGATCPRRVRIGSSSVALKRSILIPKPA